MYGKKKRTQKLAFDLFLEVIGLAVIFVVLLFMQTRFSVEQQKENSSDKLDIAIQRLEANQAEAKDRLSKYDSFSQAKIDSIAYYYENNMDDLDSVTEMAAQWSLSDLYILDAQKNIIHNSGSAAPDFKGDSVFSSFWDDDAGITIGAVRYYSIRMSNGMYAVAGRDITDFLAQEEELTSLAYSLHSIKVGSKGYIVAINAADQTIAYHPNADLIGKSFRDAQLDEHTMTDNYAGWATCANEKFYAESRAVTLSDTDYQFIALRPRVMMQNTTLKMVSMITLVFAVILTIIVLYFHFIRVEQDRQFETEHTEMEYIRISRKLYFNQTIGGKSAHILIIGLVVIFFSSFYLQTLSVLSTRSSHSAEKLEDIKAIFDENKKTLTALKEEYVEEYEGRTKNIAYLIGKDSSLADNDKLIELSKRAQVKYVYVFNDAGTVDASNGIFTEFAISHDSADPSYAYWSVIKGSKDILIKDAEENVYEPGTYIQYIGAKRIDAPGMIQLGISPQRLESRIKAVKTPYTLSNIAVENNGFTIAVAKEDSTLTYYPDESHIGNAASSVGLKDAALTDDYAGYQTIDGTKCFVTSMDYGPEYIYVAVPLSEITAGRTTLSVVATLTSLIILLILFGLSLIGQPTKVLTQSTASPDGGPLKEPAGTIEIITASGKVRRVESILSRWNPKGIKWRDCTAEQKLKKVIFGLCAMLTIALVFYMFAQQGSYDRNSILSYIINKRWEKLPNIFSFTYIALIILEVVVIATVLRKLLSLSLTSMGTRLETIGRLLNSFIKYLSVLGTLFYCLSFVGIQSSTILASAGLLTLIVGLGAQSMVSDILAGIFIVFEGEFRVGDIVTVNGYRGIVREIGIRSTKIEDFAQDIKILNNSQISGVINQTKKYSYAAIDIGIEYDESLERVESILQKELPLMKDRLPAIASGPFYRGVSSLGDSSVNIKIVAQCAEANRVQLTRDINRELKLIFDKHHIGIPFPQVTVHQPSAQVKPKATKLEKASAQEFVNDQKAKTKGMAEEDGDGEDDR
ncbi:MAG: mechanosensitive ion channel family protein [Lachnospiraceae bacterium]|nr:mechanosensitive ion channel family protein [Lachnospiraceae bacterium]